MYCSALSVITHNGVSTSCVLVRSFHREYGIRRVIRRFYSISADKAYEASERDVRLFFARRQGSGDLQEHHRGYRHGINILNVGKNEAPERGDCNDAKHVVWRDLTTRDFRCLPRQNDTTRADFAHQADAGRSRLLIRADIR